MTETKVQNLHTPISWWFCAARCADFSF